jgi:hypothetical protein
MHPRLQGHLRVAPVFVLLRTRVLDYSLIRRSERTDRLRKSGLVQRKRLKLLLFVADQTVQLRKESLDILEVAVN